MTGFYVCDRSGQPCYYTETQDAAIQWASNSAPRNPPKGFRWDVYRNDGRKVATLRYNHAQVTVRTLDNPLNTWVRSLDDGKLYRTA